VGQGAWEGVRTGLEMGLRGSLIRGTFAGRCYNPRDNTSYDDANALCGRGLDWGPAWSDGKRGTEQSRHQWRQPYAPKRHT
jgi:hypothetical protein